jgi:O-acetyl-ADP-ribose deacetylase (regulator of RNase III)
MPSVAERIRVVRGDITTLAEDAIVNAANSTLLGGGGVDGAIHRAAGRGLYEECKGLGGCPTGEARITGGYDLPARHVIHTVGPVWSGGGRGEDGLLADCYRNSLELASQHGLKTVAFPAISTGVYRFPLGRATGIAVGTVVEFLKAHPEIERVTFVAFGDDAQAAYRREVDARR